MADEKLVTNEKKGLDLEKIRSVVTYIILGALCISGWFFFFSQTMPQMPEEKAAANAPNTSGRPPGMGGEEKTEGTFVLSYTLVLLSIGLALMFVTRPSNRRDRFRTEQYAGIKVTQDEPAK